MEQIYHAPWEFKAYGQGVRIYEHCIILRPEMISLGDGVRIDAMVKIEGGQGVTIGENVHIASFSHINGGGGEVVFGAHSGCASGVKLAGGYPDLTYLHVSASEPPELCHVVRKRTVIGEYVVLFSNAIICPGVTIGDGAIIGAGSVVTKDVPPWYVVAGNPCRIIKRRVVGDWRAEEWAHQI